MNIVILNESDISAIPPEWLKARIPFLALTPSAQVKLKSIGCVAQLRDMMDESHLFCASFADESVSEMMTAVEMREVRDSTSVMVRHIVWQLAVIVARLVKTLPNEKCKVWDGVRWVDCGNQQEAIEKLIEKIIRFGQQHVSVRRAPWGVRGYRALTRLAARVANGQHVWCVSPRTKLKMGLSNSLAHANMKVAVVESTRGDASDFYVLCKGLLGQGNIFRAPPVAENDPEHQRNVNFFNGLALSFSRLEMRAAWSTYQPVMETNSRGMLGILRTTTEVAALLRARAFFCNDVHEWGSAAVCESGRSLGVPTILVNHNSHPYIDAEPARGVLGELLRNRCFNSLISEVWSWSPEIQKWSDIFQKEGASGHRLRSFRNQYPVRRTCPGRFRILHAGNYQNWSDFFPWVAETSAEFVESLSQLARAVADNPQIELVIRIRPKLEVDLDVVRQMVPLAGNVTVCGVEEDFLEQLAGADMLASFFSTTVEQAAQMGKPVLLFGRTRRFLQLPARLDPPTANDRAAIYAVHEPDGLSAMLTACAEHHRKPLHADEYARYNFLPGTPGLDALAAGIAAGRGAG